MFISYSPTRSAKDTSSSQSKPVKKGNPLSIGLPTFQELVKSLEASDKSPNQSVDTQQSTHTDDDQIDKAQSLVESEDNVDSTLNEIVVNSPAIINNENTSVDAVVDINSTQDIVSCQVVEQVEDDLLSSHQKTSVMHSITSDESSVTRATGKSNVAQCNSSLRHDTEDFMERIPKEHGRLPGSLQEFQGLNDMDQVGVITRNRVWFDLFYGANSE